MRDASLRHLAGVTLRPDGRGRGRRVDQRAVMRGTGQIHKHPKAHLDRVVESDQYEPGPGQLRKNA